MSETELWFKWTDEKMQRCGFQYELGVRTPIIRLQWSHALSGVETAGPSARRENRAVFESPLLTTPKV